jgi:hypothetical protein
MLALDASAVLDWATAGTGATALAQRWNSPLLVDVNERTLAAVLEHPGLLADRQVADADKRPALSVLAGFADALPEDVRGRLKPIAASISEQPSSAPVFPGEHEKDAKGAAALLEAALGALDQEGAATRIIDLLAGDATHRRWAAHVAVRLGHDQEIGILATLIEDDEVGVRATAAAGLASLVAADRGGALAVNALRRAAREPGVVVPRSIADVLRLTSERSSVAQQVLDELRSHASATVRRIVAEPD